MAQQKINILFFNFGEGNRFTDSILKLYAKNEEFKHAFVDYQEDAIDILRDWENGIILAKINKKSSLAEVLSLLKLCKRGIRDNIFKFAAFNDIAKPNIEPVLRKFGVSEMLEESIRPKTLKFKIDFWSKTLKSRNEEGDDGKTTVKGSNQEQDTHYDNKLKINFVEPMDAESDCWILSHKNDCKKILRRWLIKLTGPGPAAGHWSEVENKNDPRSSYWRWKFNDNWQDFVTVEGYWYFCGTKPEFDWKEKKWNFSGDNPTLLFKEGSEYHYRFKFDQGELNIAENSEFALAQKDLIEDSMAEEVSFENEGAITDDEHKMKSDQDLGGKLKGNVENEEDDEFSSKEKDTKRNKPEFNIEPEDELEENQEKEEIEDKELDFQNKDEEEEKEEKKSKFREDDLGGNIEGKGKTDKSESGPLSGDVEFTEKEEKEDRKSKFKEDAIDGNLKGKGKTDKSESGPLSGEVELKDSEKKENKKSKFKEDAIDGNMKGKIEGGKNKSKGDNSSDFKEEEHGGHYKGEMEQDIEEVEEKEIFGKKKTFFREEDPEALEREAEEKNKKKNDKKKAQHDAKMDELDKLEQSLAKDRSDKTSKIEREKSTKVDLSQFERKESIESNAKNKEEDKNARRRPKGLKSGDILQTFDKEGNLLEDEDNSLNVGQAEIIETADGEKVSLESGELRAILIKENSEQGSHIICKFEDLTDEEVVLQVPNDKLTQNESSSVHLSFIYSSTTASLKLEGNITEILDYDEDYSLVTLTFKEKNEELVNNFMKLYRARQENISKFLKTARGLG